VGGAKLHRLVNEFAAAAAGDDQGGGLRGLAQLHADKLVQGIVAAYVFPAGQDLALLVQRQGGMEGAALAGLALPGGDALAQVPQTLGLQGGARDQGGELGQRMLYGLHPADAAAARPGQAALASPQLGQAAVGDGDVEHHPLLGRGALDVVHIVVAPDDPLAKQEADGEVVEIIRGGHHDGVVDAVDVDGHGHLFHQLIQPGQP